MHNGSRALVAAACAAPFIVFLGVYLPTAGHGFISDDFGWLMHNRISTLSDLWRIVRSDNGFYRPVVALSFAVNDLMFGLNARAYGLTNVLLAALCGASMYGLCRALRLPRGAATFASALWLLNLHGVNMSILWISGRTALLATAAAVSCAAALLKGRLLLAMLLLTVAIFSREDVAPLPLVTTAWVYMLQRPQGRMRPWHWLLAGMAIVAVYFAIRSTTNAMTPATAPSYYRFTHDPAVVARNIGEYADRTATTAAGTLLLLAIVLRQSSVRFDHRSTAIVACGAMWTVAFLLPALLLPVRSSLYACLPAVGTCVMAAAIATRWWALAEPMRRKQALVAAAVVPFLLAPVFYARTDRWVRMAEFSTRALADLASALKPFPDDSDIVIEDDRSTRANMASVFSTLLREGFQVTTGRFMTFYVDPPIPNAFPNNGGLASCNGCEEVRLVVKDGGLAPVSSRNR
jgi:hypothetical protein